MTQQSEKTRSPFDFVTSVSFSKEYLLETEQNEQEYNSFITNRALSYFKDSIFYANEMNKSCLDKKLQYDFYFNALPKRKRFSKWYKVENSDKIQLICAYYKYSVSKAKAILPLLSEEDIKIIKTKLEKGGSNKDGVD